MTSDICETKHHWKPAQGVVLEDGSGGFMGVDRGIVGVGSLGLGKGMGCEDVRW